MVNIELLTLNQLGEKYLDYVKQQELEVLDVSMQDNRELGIVNILAMVYNKENDKFALVSFSSIIKDRMRSFILKDDLHYITPRGPFMAVKQYFQYKAPEKTDILGFAGIYSNRYKVTIGAMHKAAIYLGANKNLVHPNVLTPYVYLEDTPADELGSIQLTVVTTEKKGEQEQKVVGADYMLFLEAYKDAVTNGNYGFAIWEEDINPIILRGYINAYKSAKEKDILKGGYPDIIEAYVRFKGALNELGGGLADPRLPKGAI